MYRVATVWVIDPDHHKPSTSGGSADLIRVSIGHPGLDSTYVAKYLLDLCNGDVSFGMIGSEVPTVGGIPDYPPIVHPSSIYKLDGQKGWLAGLEPATPRSTIWCSAN